MATKNTELALIRDALLGAREPIFIFSHPSPDGDSIGSTLGVYGILTAAGIKAQPVLPDLPRVYEFLADGIKILKPPVDLKNKIALVLDCGDLARLQQSGLSLDGAVKVINIDHHLHNDFFGDLNYVDSKAAAVGEIIHQIFGNFPQYYSPRVAEALYTALVTDTGRFSYSNTSAEVLRAAATLVEWGACPQKVYNHLYENRSQNYYEFLAQALSRIELHFADRVALLPLERRLLLQYNLEDWELDEINDYPRSLAGVSVSIVLTETEEGIAKASLRSKGRNVAAIARAFGGGGHNNAAGATLQMPLSEARNQLQKFLEQERDL